MLKDDWLMKLIKQAVQAVHHVMGFMEADQLDEAEEAIDETLRELTGLSWDQLDSMTATEISSYLGANEQAGIGQMILVADLMRVSAEIGARDGDEAREFNNLVRALEIRLGLAIGRDLSNAHLDGTIDELEAALEEFVLPTNVAQALLTYYEKTTQYDKAENYLWELIDEHITDNDMVSEGLAFYERLMQKTDTELAVGSMTRPELEDGFNELWEKKRG